MDIKHENLPETPVAVPCRDPPTPHRINMPNSRVDEPDVKLLIGAIDKKPESRTLSPIQRITAKTGKGPGKLKNNKSGTNESSFGANTNQKVTAYFPVRRSVRKSKKTVLEEKQRDFEQKVIAQIEEGLEVGTKIRNKKLKTGKFSSSVNNYFCTIGQTFRWKGSRRCYDARV